MKKRKIATILLAACLLLGNVSVANAASIDTVSYTHLDVYKRQDRDTLSQIEKLLNEGDNAKNIWTHAWICMHDAANEIVNSQANMTKANQYSLWHEAVSYTHLLFSFWQF